MKCSNCNREIPDGSEFCSFCGAKQEEAFYCYKCGRKLPSDSDFCQFCGTKQLIRAQQEADSKKTEMGLKKSKKSIIIVSVTVLVLCAIAVIVFVVLKPFEKKSDDNTIVKEETTAAEEITTAEETTTEKKEDPFDSMSLDEKVGQSKKVSLSSFRKKYNKLVKKNVHLSGYVVDTKDWLEYESITIASAIQWPYETTDKEEYYGYIPEHIEEWIEQERSWETVPKTPSVICNLKADGVAEGTPKEGDIVDVYCIVTQRPINPTFDYIKIYPYYIKVR